MFRGPGVPEGLRESRPVSLIDVLPTLYFLLDLSPPTDLHGTPLFGEQAPTELGDLFSTCSRGATVTEDGRWKLHLPSERIMGRGAEPVLFDLESDPLERTPIEDPSREARLRAKIAAWTALYKEDAEALPIEKQRQLLLQMGYVGLAEELTEDMTPEEKQRLFKIEKEELEERRRAEALAGDEDG